MYVSRGKGQNVNKSPYTIQGKENENEKKKKDKDMYILGPPPHKKT